MLIREKEAVAIYGSAGLDPSWVAIIFAHPGSNH